MNGIYYGNGWGYKPGINGHAATLYLCPDVPKEFDLNYKKVRCNIEVSQTATLTKLSISFAGDNFTINNAGTIQNSEFSLCSVTNTGTIKDSTFRKTNVTNENSITGCFWLELYGDPTGTISNSGIITNSLFQVDPHTVGLDKSTVVHTFRAIGTDSIWCDMPDNPCFARHSNESYTSSCFYTIGSFKIAVHYDDDYGPKYSYKITAINGIPAEKSGHGISYDGTAWYTLTVDNEDIVLSDAFDTSLEIVNGYPNTNNREPIYATDATDDTTIIGWKGNGWKYEIDSHTLTLENGEYNFSNSKDGLGQLAPDVKLVVGPNATLTGGVFNEKPDVLTTDNVQTIILNGSGSIKAVNDLSSEKWSKTLYAIKGSQVKIKASVPLADINCRVIDPHYYPDSRDKTTLLFTINGDFIYSYTKLGETELTLNKSTRTNLIMLDNGCPNLEGVPYNWDSMYTYTGDGWKYVFNNSGSLRLNDTSSYNFRYLDPLSKNGNKLAAVTCGIINSGATIEDGVFKNLVINHSGIISGGTFAVGLFSIDSEDFSTSGTVTGGAFNGKDGLSDGAHAVTVNGGSIRKVNDTEPLVLDSSHNLTTGTEWNLYSYEGTIVTVTADTDITNINGWDIGKFPGGSSYPNGEDDKTTVSFRMPDGPVVLNDTLYTLDIIRGKTLGNTSVAVPAGTELPLVADKPAENETFLGWTLSDESLLTKGTLNDPNCTTITIKMKNASATAEAMFQKDTPAYTLTVTGGGLVNGKTSAVVEAGKEVRLTVGEMQDGMSFNYWDLPTALLKALTDSSSGGFSNKVEPLTFTMPNLSGYTEDTRFTIRLDIRPAELPDDDDGPSVLGTMATVAVGGAAAGILVWQGVSLGVDSYLQLSLPGGVPVPTNRRELVKLLWETAGKPDVVLPALYGDVSTEDGELQKATRWAIDNGLVKPADEGDASRFDPDRSVSKYEVARAWFKVQQMLK